MDSNVLIVYYSRTGTTRTVADAIAHELKCDVEEIHDRVVRRGPVGYFRSGFEASFRRETSLVEPSHDPERYDLVIVGSPVWNASLSSPVRTYLNRYRSRFDRIAFFVTLGGTGAQRVLGQMAECAGRDPIATMAVRELEVEHGSYKGRIQDFLDQIEHGPAHVHLGRFEPSPAY